VRPDRAHTRLLETADGFLEQFPEEKGGAVSGCVQHTYIQGGNFLLLWNSRSGPEKKKKNCNNNSPALAKGQQLLLDAVHFGVGRKKKKIGERSFIRCRGATLAHKNITMRRDHGHKENY
jgi:hypothetical protein